VRAFVPARSEAHPGRWVGRLRYRALVGEIRGERLRREEGRHLFGLDPSGYDAGRPDYPPWVYDRLVDQCGLVSGARVVEVGPGTGIVTRRLLGAGASVVAVEPDANLAAHLRDAFPPGNLIIVESPFEAADLLPGSADLVVAATSFHWVEREPGMRKIRAVLRPGGQVALWWTLFFDRSRPDPFGEATAQLQPWTSAEFAERGRPEFQLDVEQRCADLLNVAELVDVRAEIAHWGVTLTTQQIHDLYASMAPVRRRPPDEQAAILDGLRHVADETFSGLVYRPFVTVLYTGHRA
jgi:SAM-dependent methyltransferase